MKGAASGSGCSYILCFRLCFRARPDARSKSDKVPQGKSVGAGSGAISEKGFAQCTAALGGGAFVADKLRKVVLAPAGFLDHKIHDWGFAYVADSLGCCGLGGLLHGGHFLECRDADMWPTEFLEVQ